MDDFETQLSDAFLTPRGEADALTDQIVSKVARLDARRRFVVAGAGLIGLALCAALLGASGAIAAARRGLAVIWAEISSLTSQIVMESGTGVALAAFGLILLAVAASRHLLRDV